MYPSIICIYPTDKTIDFLEPISVQLSKRGIGVIRIDHVDESVKKTKEIITNAPENSLIVFIGHGASNCLYAGADEGGEKKEFINKGEYDIFENKNIILFACRSAEFIENNIGIYNPKEGIGFGDIPTDWEDMLRMRDDQANIHPDIGKKELIYFREKFASIFINALEMALNNTPTFSKIKSYLKLFINKEISFLLLNKEIENYRAIADLLVSIKMDIRHYNFLDIRA